MVPWTVARHPIITLTTDFGLRDAYVSIMKGVILDIAPHVSLVDISHEVTPQNVGEGGYLLLNAYRYFPVDAIHLAVVDPGVGTARRGIAVRAPHGLFVGPDNGLFASALADQQSMDGQSGALQQGSAVDLTDPRYRRNPVSHTFHGRDIFAPAAAHLAAGTPLSELGPPCSALAPGTRDEPVQLQSGVQGRIIHVDRFGNAISNVRAALLPASPVFEIGGQRLEGLATSYQERALAAIVGSAGFVEIAARNGSASAVLNLKVGDTLLVRSAL